MRTASNAFGHSAYNPFPPSNKAAKPDDASMNPILCPCPRHNRCFLHAVEERYEFVNICDAYELPVKHLGCIPGCLAFLEQEDHEEEEEEIWEVDED
jgi:hypothetical protein